MSMYPKTIELSSEKLRKLLDEKADFVLQGRQLSDEIVSIEEKMDAVDKELQEVEKSVDCKDLEALAQEITLRFNGIMEEMEAVKTATRDRMVASVGPELPAKYEALKTEKEALELKRNKVALKIQKRNDKIVPIGRTLMRPFLEAEYDDFDTLRLENGEIVATIFNHWDDFKKRFAKSKLTGN